MLPSFTFHLVRVLSNHVAQHVDKSNASATVVGQESRNKSFAFMRCLQNNEEPDDPTMWDVKKPNMRCKQNLQKSCDLTASGFTGNPNVVRQRAADRSGVPRQ
jgi:hypothetical protein